MCVAHWVNSDATEAPLILLFTTSKSRSLAVRRHLFSCLGLIGYCLVTCLVSIKSRPVSRVAANKNQTDATAVQPTH